jgi:hypothetical protein
LLPLAKVAAILALGFVIRPVVDYLALGIPLNVVGCRVRDSGNANAGGMPSVPAKKQVLRAFALVAFKGGQGQRTGRH